MKKPSTGAPDQQLVDVFETMSDAFFAIDKNWIIVRVNAEHEKKSQIKREDQLGKKLLEVFFSMPEARTSVYWVSYHTVMEQRVPVAFEAFYAPLELWTHVRAFPTPDGGMAVFFTDTTEQKKSSQRIQEERHKLESVFVDSPASMGLLRGPTFIVEKLNAKYKALMGGRDVLGKPILEARPELKGQPFFDLMKQVYETGEPFVAHEMKAFIVRRPGGQPEESWFDFTYSRVDDGVGQAYGIFVHAVDVTENVVARMRIEHLAARLQVAVHYRDEFLSIASHELKAPLTSVIMQLQLLRRTIKPDENVAPSAERLARTLDGSLRQMDKLTALIDDLLDVTRLDSGKMSYHFEPVELNELVQEVTERLTGQLNAAGCPFQLQLAESVIIDCDRFRIEQVVTNLITNAAKYGAGTPVSISVSTTKTGALIRVQDQGMGIPLTKHARIFDRFERAISHEKISGLGLGLYITRQIVEAHHGAIQLRSAPGEGSTFTVELLRAPPAVMRRPAATSA
ncbi:MAG TPA: ATP-binding protein [Myxococcales bacterium]|nr:ATP-binding protein [Myxococcales bacterium]